MCAKQLILAGGEKNLYVIDAVSGEIVSRLRGHTDQVISLAVLPSVRVASGSKDGTVKIWDLERGSCVRTLDVEARSTGEDEGGGFCGITSLTYLPESDLLAAGENDCVRLWRWRTGECVKVLKAGIVLLSVCALDKPLCGRNVLLTGEYESANLWDVRTGRSFHRLAPKGLFWLTSVCSLPRTQADRGLDIGPKDQLVAVGTRDGVIKILSVSGESVPPRRITVSGDECVMQTLVGHRGEVTGLNYFRTRDGRVILVSSSKDGMVKVWDIFRGRCMKTLQGHTLSVNGLGLDAAAKVFATCSTDYTVRVWSLERLACRKQIQLRECLHSVVTLSLNGAVGAGGASRTPASPASLPDVTLGSVSRGERFRFLRNKSSIDRSPDLVIRPLMRVLGGKKLRCTVFRALCVLSGRNLADIDENSVVDLGPEAFVSPKAGFDAEALHRALFGLSLPINMQPNVFLDLYVIFQGLQMIEHMYVLAHVLEERVTEILDLVLLLKTASERSSGRPSGIVHHLMNLLSPHAGIVLSDTELCVHLSTVGILEAFRSHEVTPLAEHPDFRSVPEPQETSFEVLFTRTCRVLFDTRRYGDMKLKAVQCQDSGIKVHKVISALRSNLLSQVFQAKWARGNHLTVNVFETQEEVQAFVEYLYLDDIQTDDMPLLTRLLQVARQFSERDLETCVFRRMESVSSALQEYDALQVDMEQWSEFFGDQPTDFVEYARDAYRRFQADGRSEEGETHAQRIEKQMMIQRKRMMAKIEDQRREIMRQRRQIQKLSKRGCAALFRN